MTARPTVTVMMITYRHEEFVAQALDSALSQETSFDVDIVVSDDASSDGTPAIIAEFAARYPDRIQAVLRRENVGVARNWVDTLLACRGKYVAFLEGDDYWDSPHKLQKQVDELEAHPDAALCSHPVKVVSSETGEVLAVTAADPRDSIAIEDVIRYRYPLPTCGVLMRNVLKSVPSWFQQVHNLDYATQLMAATHGNVRILHEPMGVYRKHPGGVSVSTSIRRQIDRFIFLLQSANAELGLRYDRLFRGRLARLYRAKIRLDIEQRQFLDALTSAAQFLRYTMTSAGWKSR